MTLSETIAKYIILFSQKTPFRGEGSYASNHGANCVGTSTRYSQAKVEADRFDDFFSFFNIPDVTRWFTGKHILDLGSGYGGRTVEYVRQLGVEQITGIEVFPNMVDLSCEYARSLGINSCSFILGEQLSIPMESESLDAVVSYDVLEHVVDPRVTLLEIHRLLKPKGRAFIVLTPYHGMLSHHLTYITRIPGIHWLFPPETLINAINAILNSPEGDKFNTVPQPKPVISYNGRRAVLPTLNGLTSKEFLEMLEGFDILELQQLPLLARYNVFGSAGVAFNRMLMGISPIFRDAFSFNLSCILEKKG